MPRRQYTAKQTKKVAFPRYPLLDRHQAEKGSPPCDEYQHREKERAYSPFKPTSEEQVTKIGEDDPTGADVDSRATHEPGANATSKTADNRTHPEIPFLAENDEAAKNREPSGVCEKVAKTTMEEGSKQDAEEPAWGAGNYAKRLQPTAKSEPIDYADEPDAYDQDPDNPECATQFLEQRIPGFSGRRVWTFVIGNARGHCAGLTWPRRLRISERVLQESHSLRNSSRLRIRST